jgi:hypothetical protein
VAVTPLESPRATRILAGHEDCAMHSATIVMKHWVIRGAPKSFGAAATLSTISSSNGDLSPLESRRLPVATVSGSSFLVASHMLMVSLRIPS